MDKVGWFFLCSCLFVCLCVIDFILLMCSDEIGDRPRPLPKIDELKGAVDVTERKGDPSWDYDVGVVLVLLLLIG